jgi:RNA polymerase sigma-70 factor (subfamily 1)
MSVSDESIRGWDGRIDRESLADPNVFAHAFRRLRGRLSLFVSVRLGPALRARVTEDDVLQETFLEAYRSLDRITEPGEESFARWLFAIAENRIRDLAKYHGAGKREAAREKPLQGTTPDDPGPLARLVAAVTSPAGRARRSELARRLAACLDRLSEELREIVVLHVIEGQTFKAIAARLHRRPQTVSALYIEALERLKRELGPGFTY